MQYSNANETKIWRRFCTQCYIVKCWVCVGVKLDGICPLLKTQLHQLLFFLLNIHKRLPLMWREWGHDTCDNVIMWLLCHPHYQWLMSYRLHYIWLSAPPSEAISCWHLDVWCVWQCAHKNQSGPSIDLTPVLGTGVSLGQGYQDNPTSSSHLFRLSPTHPSLQPTIGILFSQYNRRIGFFFGSP